MTTTEVQATPESALPSTSVQTPDGIFSIIAGHSAVLASGWTADLQSLELLIHPSLRSIGDPGLAPTSTRYEDLGADVVLSQAVKAVQEYYDGDLTAISAVPVHQKSGPFRQKAWDVLREVGPGKPVTYREYAAATGSPTAARAAAAACAMNAAALFVPCHRVIRSDGTLGGFRYGLPLKQDLLLRESR